MGNVSPGGKAMDDFAKVDFSKREVSESLARAYAVAIRIKQPTEVKESPGSYGVWGEPQKPARKPKKVRRPKQQEPEPPMIQEKMF